MEKITVEIIAKKPYEGSGPRGVDVYATELEKALQNHFPNDSYALLESGRTTPNLTHYTFFDPFFPTLSQVKHEGPYIVTVHDLIPLVHKDHFPSGIRGTFNWWRQRHALRQAAAIITDSKASKDDIQHITGVESDHIHVIPLATPQVSVPTPLSKVRSHYKLPDKYVLYVGDLNWNKNIPGLIKMMSSVKTDAHVVLVGKAFTGRSDIPEYQAIEKVVEETGMRQRVHKLGFVTAGDLATIYKHAMLYIQPSWDEGFGLTVLEALNYGCPVLSSDRGSLPEVGGDVVHYMDVGEEEKATKILQQLLDHSVIRNKYIKKGALWAKSFTWAKVATMTHEVYEHVYQGTL